MARPLPLPLGVFSLECETRKNPPGIQLFCSVELNLPHGPKGLGFRSPSAFQAPAKYSSFFTSGPGVCGAGGFCADASTVQIRVAITTVAKRLNINISLAMPRMHRENRKVVL